MSRKPTVMPDLDDDADFRRRLSPLLKAALPEDRRPQNKNNRISGYTDSRISVLQDDCVFHPELGRLSGRVGAAEEQARIEKLRGEKRRFEYLIPERVGRALAADAVAQGKSATTRLLEVLRDAGYPVIEEDLVDLRKLPKR